MCKCFCDSARFLQLLVFYAHLHILCKFFSVYAHVLVRHFYTFTLAKYFAHEQVFLCLSIVGSLYTTVHMNVFITVIRFLFAFAHFLLQWRTLFSQLSTKFFCACIPYSSFAVFILLPHIVAAHLHNCFSVHMRVCLSTALRFCCAFARFWTFLIVCTHISTALRFLCLVWN